MGAMNFLMADIYGNMCGTTEKTIPEPEDQKALVEDEKAAELVSTVGKKKFPIAVALVLAVVIIVLMGGKK